MSTSVRQHFQASAEKVYDAWISPEFVQKWLSKAALEFKLGRVISATIDPRVGGRYAFIYQNHLFGMQQSGEYTELQRPNRIVFTWDIALPEREFIVVAIEPNGAGCDVILEHRFDPRSSSDNSSALDAWARTLEIMSYLLDPG